MVSHITLLCWTGRVRSNKYCGQILYPVYPTISSGKSTKVIIVSTPNGLNHFYKLWNNDKGRNSYNNIEAHWSEVPVEMQGGKKKLLQTPVSNNSSKNSNVGGPTTIEVLDNETGEIKNLTMEELYNTL